MSLEARVAIAIPSHSDAPVKFALALSALVGSSMDIRVTLMNVQGAYLPVARNTLVEKALREQGVERILFVDTDMLFPPDSLHRLWTADKDIVGANYVRRGVPHDSLARGMNGASQNVHGIVEVEQLPTGLMLVKCSVFERLERPWFMTPWLEDAKNILSEDYYFCDKARANGFSVWMDTQLSTEILHLGDVGFRWLGAGNYERVEMV
jgi:hypothetical protein